jgi:hypothetical protein
MLRDMEELLNSVIDAEIKDYMREALNCYNSRSYKASVIMSVIAGTYDLHKKVKSLASSDPKFRELDEIIEKKIKELEPYEKYLIEKCGTNDIDMLNSNESKELIRCLSIRNDCAHPSNFICSAEKARDIFSSIIDIICSKPVLYGCNKLIKLIEELKDSTFFTVYTHDKVKEIVKSNIDKFQSKAKVPLLKGLANTIIQTDHDIQRKNAIYFLALSEKCMDDYSEQYLKEFLKDENEKYLVQLLGINPNILNYFEDIDIERIIHRFKNSLSASQINNLKDWIKVILSEKIIKDDYFYGVIDSLFNEENNYSIVLEILKGILDSDSNEELRNIILNKLSENYKHVFNEKVINDKNLLEFIKIIDDNEVYERWLSFIIDYFSSTSNFYAQNKIIDYSFKKIPEKFWINKVSENIKIKFVKVILSETNPSIGNRPNSAVELMITFQDIYPNLIDGFLEQLIQSEDINDLEKYEWYINSYIKKSEKKNELEKKLKIIKEESKHEISFELNEEFDTYEF